MNTLPLGLIFALSVAAYLTGAFALSRAGENRRWLDVSVAAPPWQALPWED